MSNSPEGQLSYVFQKGDSLCFMKDVELIILVGYQAKGLNVTRA